ncbi:hypothetical protein [Pseudomonas sp. TE50-2]|jgi:hypothetical protein|uniref:hypothetical protein n=1 Tax=Pseudomonas sp. TE50-2 TaxID=3142707 RepID=UPI00346647ED
MSNETSIVISRKVICFNVVGFAGLVLIFVMLGRIFGSSGSASLASWIATVILAVLAAVLGWQMGWNRATIHEGELSLRAGFYHHRWPAKILEMPWKTHKLSEFHRDNGVHIYGYAAGYYSRGASKRQFMLVINTDQVRCLTMEGYSSLCLDAATHDRILAKWQASVR